MSLSLPAGRQPIKEFMPLKGAELILLP